MKKICSRDSNNNNKKGVKAISKEKKVNLNTINIRSKIGDGNFTNSENSKILEQFSIKNEDISQKPKLKVKLFEIYADLVEKSDNYFDSIAIVRSYVKQVFTMIDPSSR